MRYVALDACRKPGRTDILQYSLFHGVAERDDAPFPTSPSHSLGDDLLSPLKVCMGGNYIPHIFRPCASLVVSDTIRSTLSGIQNIEFMPICFRKLVNFPYRAGDFSYYESESFKNDPYHNRSDTLLKRLPDDSKLHVVDSSYSELVLPNMYRLLEGQTS